MSDEKKNENLDNEEEQDIITLTDENGEESDYEVMGTYDEENVTYVALYPLKNNEKEEYVILKTQVDESGEEMLITIDDDDEFDRVADIFEDMLFDEIDYDEDGKNGK